MTRLDHILLPIPYSLLTDWRGKILHFVQDDKEGFVQDDKDDYVQDDKDDYVQDDKDGFVQDDKTQPPE